MKISLLFILLVASIIEGKSQSETKIEASKLTKLTETSNFSGLVQLAHSLSYITVDSSMEKDKSLIYITKEPKSKGNILGCTLRPDKKINQISFSTHDKATYDKFKKQIIDLGFKAGSQGTGGFPEVIESQDFEKGNFLISASALKKYDEIKYEFIFMKW